MELPSLTSAILFQTTRRQKNVLIMAQRQSDLALWSQALSVVPLSWNYKYPWSTLVLVQTVAEGASGKDQDYLCV